MILIDADVVLDTVQKREPDYGASADLLNAAIERRILGALASHTVTAIHGIMARDRDRESADEVVDWLLNHFAVIPIRHSDLLRARKLQWPDFDDAVVAAVAESSGCQAIVTRNVQAFADSPVQAWTPDNYLVTVQYKE